MEITTVESIPLAALLSDGVVGWGEAPGPPETLATIVDEILADWLVGVDPLHIASLSERAYAELSHLGPGGSSSVRSARSTSHSGT